MSASEVASKQIKQIFNRATIPPPANGIISVAPGVRNVNLLTGPRRWRWFAVCLPPVCLLMLVAGCSVSSPRNVVVVGFSGNPADPVPGRVMTSPDGETWNLPLPVGENGEWLTAVKNRGTGFAALGLSGGLYYADPTASQWSFQQMNDSWLSALTFLPSHTSVGYMAGAGQWWRSEDGGASWESHTPPGYFFGDFAFQDPLHGVAVEGDLVPSLGIVWRTTDGGSSWQKASQQIAGLRAVASDGVGGLWAAGDRGLLVSSTDGGANWALVDRVWDGVPGLVPDYAGFDFAGGTGFLVGSQGIVRRFQPGLGWSQSRLGDYELHGIFARDAQNAFACGYLTHSNLGVVLATHDGGNSWAVVVESPGVFWYGITGTRP